MDLPSLNSFTSLIPQAPRPQDQLSAQKLQMLLGEQQKEQHGYNALAEAMRNPANMQNGMLNQNALSQIGSGGNVKVMLDMMEAQAKIQQQQQATALNAQKFNEAMNQASVEEMTPLLTEFDKNIGTLGPPQAQQKYTQDRAATIDRMEGSGRFTPQFIDNLRRAPANPEALRAAILGPKSVESPKEKRAEDRADQHLVLEKAAAARAEEKAAQTPFVGKVDGKEVPLRQGGPTGYMDASGNSVTPDPATVHKMGTKTEADAETAGTPTGPINLHGEEYLKALPASRSALIKGYTDGRVAFPGSFSLRSPYWQKMVADITQYDPSFDAVNYNARSSTRKDFTSGKSAQNITSFNTAIGHLGTLDKAAEALNNTKFPAFNTVANYLVSNVGDPRVVKFNTAKQAVSDELTRAFRGTGGNVYDIKGWEQNLSNAGSPEQLKGAVKQAVDLLRSRIEAIGEQYRRGMGTSADVMDLLTPAAKKTLGQLPGGEDISGDKATQIPAGSSAASPSSTAPASQEAPPIGLFKPGVTSITHPGTGETWVLRDGRVVKQ